MQCEAALSGDLIIFHTSSPLHDVSKEGIDNRGGKMTTTVRVRRPRDHFENHLTNLAARCRKKIENMKTIESIITTNGSLPVQESNARQSWIQGPSKGCLGNSALTREVQENHQYRASA